MEEEEDSGEDGWEDDTDKNLGHSSGARGTSSTGENKSLMEGADGA